MRKADVKLRGRVPAYVTSRRAAAELDISISCFLRWVNEGILPGPEPGSPPSASRWRWSRIEQWLAGDRTDVPGRQSDLFPAEFLQGHHKRGPKSGTGGRPRKLKLGADLADMGDLPELRDIDDMTDFPGVACDPSEAK